MLPKTDLKERFRWIKYTLRHKLAFLKVEKEVRGKNTLRGFLHDSDKIFLYACLLIDIKKAQELHTRYARHHLENNKPKSQADIEETVIDLVCTPLTKPDKQLSAYDALVKFYPSHVKKVLPVLKKWFPHQIPHNERS